MSAKEQQTNKEGMKAGLDETLANLEASRKKAFSQYDLTQRSLGLSEQEIALKKKQDEAKISRDRATELEVARANTDTRMGENVLGDINKYAQQAGAIPKPTASITGAKTLTANLS